MGLVAVAPRLSSSGSRVVVHGFRCSLACGILPDQRSNSCLLHWQVNSSPLSHQGSLENLLMDFSCFGQNCVTCSPLMLKVTQLANGRARTITWDIPSQTQCSGLWPLSQYNQRWPVHSTRTQQPLLGSNPAKRCLETWLEHRIYLRKSGGWV